MTSLDDQNAETTWKERLGSYHVSCNKRAALELTVTVVPLVALYAIMHWSLSIGYWLTLLLAMPTAAMLVRLFAIQHDCGHGAFFDSKRVNDWLGRLLGIFTLTPYDDWRREHALHHASSGNLDRRGSGDIDTLTVSEYRNLSGLGKLKYRLYRHPLVLFVAGPSWQFIVRNRWPTGNSKILMPLISTHSTNAGIILFSVALVSVVGWKALLAVHLPIVILGATAGIWLFFVQHQFELAYWQDGCDWDKEEAALHGSSFYDLPQPLMWLTGNIGIHHVHHLTSRIPFYSLPKVIGDFPELRQINRLTFWESLKCAPLALWDEGHNRLISFKQYRALHVDGGNTRVETSSF